MDLDEDILNLVVIREAGKDGLIRILCLITNVSFALLFGVALFQFAQPQVFIGLALFGIAILCVLGYERERGA
jgi:hypothetical protein